MTLFAGRPVNPSSRGKLVIPNRRFLATMADPKRLLDVWGAGERHQHGKATSGLHRRTGQSIGRKRTTSVYASPRSDLTLLSPKLSSIQSILSAEWVGGPSGSSPKLPALRRKLRSPGCPAPQVPKEKYCAQEAPASPRHQGEWVPPRLG